VDLGAGPALLRLAPAPRVRVNAQRLLNVIATGREVVAGMREGEEAFGRSRRNGDGQAAILWAMARSRRDHLPANDVTAQKAR
jgi:hypothetical protein